MYKTVYTEVEVDVDLSEFDTDDLVEELESRGAGSDLSEFDTDDLVEELESRGAGTGEFGDGKEILQVIYEKRRLGQNYQTELETLIYSGLGKII